jgi:hypothetical protein
MNDSLLDDVTSLLDGDFGDDRILKQISRACKNNEVISNYERNYVQKLAEQYLDKKPEIAHSEISENTSSTDTIIPKIEPSTQTQIYQTEPSRNSNSGLKNSKMVLGIGGVSIVIVIAVIAAVIGTSDVTPIISETLTIETDLSSYDNKDLISISGKSDVSNVVNLSIENQSNELVWAEQVSIKNNGQYSTLTIAGGSGWETSGTYTIIVNNGNEIKSSTFSFTA